MAAMLAPGRVCSISGISWAPHSRSAPPQTPRSIGSSPRTVATSAAPASHLHNVAAGATHQGNSSTAADPRLTSLMAEVAQGRIRPEDAARHLASAYGDAAMPQRTGDFAAADFSRAERTGFPEVVWGPGKTPLQIVTIMHDLSERGQLAIASRIEPQVAKEIESMLPSEVEYHEQARMLVLKPEGGELPPRLAGTVAVLTAGTADAFVAEECRRTANLMGCYTFKLQDLGIDSGLSRIAQNLPAIRAADVVVVFSGMDGSLPSVVAGLVDSPVIAVPTSVGYGAAFGGISPLLSALTVGAPGVATVNIDNGFGAAMLAARILKAADKIAKKIGATQQQVPPQASMNGSGPPRVSNGAA